MKDKITILLLVIILFLTFWIRVQGVERIPAGQFTENDAYTYYWQSGIIAEQGRLPVRDMSRWLPVGRDNGQLFSFYAYALGYLSKLFPWVSRYTIQIYLPVFCFTLIVGLIFVFFWRTDGELFTLIVGVVLATLPGSISRSAVGFGDRDTWCYLFGALAIFGYLFKERMEVGIHRTIVNCLCGLVVFIGGLSWEAFGVFVLVIVSLEIWKFCREEGIESYSEYLIWVLMFVPGLLLISPAYRNGYGFSAHVGALLIFPVLTVLVIRVIRQLCFKYVKVVRLHKKKLVWGLTLFSFLLGIGYIVLQSGSFASTVFSFQESRLMQNVGELQDPHFRYWYWRYGSIYILGSIGFIVCSVILWGRFGVVLAASVLLFVLTTFFRWPVSDVIGENICDVLFMVSLCLTGISVGIASLRESQKKEVYVVLAMLMWFVIWVSFARGGKRFDFFIGLPLAYGTAWLLYSSPVYVIEKLKEIGVIYRERLNGMHVAVVFSIVVLVPVLFVDVLGGHVNRSVHASAEMKKPIPGVNDVAEAFEWIKENLNENVVMAANWPHGTQLNVLGNVKTVVDSDHYLPHWIHLYYRHVFCAQDPYEALSFLKTHNATHLMMTEWEVISRSHVYSYIGSNADNDRRFRLHKFVRVDGPIGEPYQLEPESDRMPIAFIDFVSKTGTREPGTHGPVEIGKQQKLGFTIHLKTDENLTGDLAITFGKESIRTVSMGSSGLVFYFDRNGVLKQGYLLSSRGWESLAIELFLRNKA